MKIQTRCLSAVMLSVCLANSQAEEPEPTRLDPITITATRTERRVDQSLASVTVVDRAEIERRQVQSVQDLLRGVPGLSISSNGGLGKNASLYLRGTDSDHLLVLIDGVRAGSATLGTMAFQDLPVDQIERIEIVRGPRSSLYGSEAVGGVIQIFTRKGGKGFKPTLSVGAGSHSAYKVAGGVSGGDERAWYSLNGSRLETRGFNTCDTRSKAEFGGCFVDEPDPDGYRNTSGSARAGYRFDNGLEVEANLLHAEGLNKYDGSLYSGNRSPFVQQTLGGRLRYSPVEDWDMSLRAGRSIDESDSLYYGQFINSFNTERVSLSWQNDINLAQGHLLTVGLDYYNDRVSSSQRYSVDSRDDKAGFAQYQMTLGGFDAVLGTRFDDNEQFGSYPTGNVALGYRFDNDVRLSASWGNAFKAPTFNELYYPNYGTPTLTPENSESWEVGVSGKQAGVSWSLNGYHTEIDNMITPVFDLAICKPPYYYCAQNLERVRIVGLEGQASTRLWGFDLATTLSLLDPENRSAGANRGNRLARRSQAMFRFDIDRAVGPVKLGATVHGEDRRFDDVANAHRLNGFVTVDLRATVAIHAGLSLEARLANLLDEHYETARYFHQDGRNFFLTLRYQPEAL
ncbi:TonB-dependent vitamin B12 receptor [Methylococcus sp. EFPC2]|uniref:TonB-dependent vitamin B12 receptor n=1 Tax=Methylococcus sp. EFPC2 TaxID=2812648 RepID=UPI0019688171|nr:TonB-dependent vitamin B12 receptor [Methylococcus sp. EFPC2]QSA98659.1 TonB-dependent vitamin B12 receptor [Methylococcus sp. EFPC2]